MGIKNNKLIHEKMDKELKNNKIVTEMLEIEGKNSDRDKETTKRQDKNNNKEYNKENQEIFTTQELENDKKDKKVEKINCLNKISTIGKPLTNIMKYVEENPERDKNTIKKQDKIRENTRKEAPMDKNNAKQ